MGTSLIGMLNMSQQSIANNQTALTVVSNNIANMNNSSYSKQTVKFSAIPAYDTYNWCSSIGSLQIGHGAEITGIMRNREQWLDNYFRDQSTSMGYYSQIGTMTNNIENLMNKELSSTGLQKTLSDFFSASQALTAEPNNNAYRIAFIEAAQDVADQLNSMSSTLNAQREQAVGKVGDPDSFEDSTIKMTTDSLNEKLSKLAEINGKIAQSFASGSASNDLLDQRDALLDELSGMMPLTITTNQNLTVNVIIGDKTVVKGGEQRLFFEAVQTADDDNPVQINLKDKDGNIKINNANEYITSGSLKGLLDIGGVGELSYKSVLSEIDKIAKAFADEMNKIQTGLGADGVAGSIPYCIADTDPKTLTQATEPLFVASDGGDFTAGNIKINENILNNTDLIATARGDATLEGSESVGNASNMELFNNLEKLKIPALNNGGTGQTLAEFIKTLVSNVGSKIESVNNSKTAQNSVVQQAASKRAEKTNVSLNEELSDLIKYQRSYEASARIFSVASELLQTLVNLGR